MRILLTKQTGEVAERAEKDIDERICGANARFDPYWEMN